MPTAGFARRRCSSLSPQVPLRLRQPSAHLLCLYFRSPELDDDIDIELDMNEVRVDTYRASGAGGQHVNKTDSAIRLTHIPSGIVVQCQNQRSQHKNRDQAVKQLKAKLYEMEEQKQKQALQAIEDSKSDISWGSQIRSYVLDSARIKDLRTGVETSNTQNVLDGELNDFIEASLKQGFSRLVSGPKDGIQSMSNEDQEQDLPSLIAQRQSKLLRSKRRG